MLLALLSAAGWIAVAGWLEYINAIEMEDESVFPQCASWIPSTDTTPEHDR